MHTLLCRFQQLLRQLPLSLSPKGQKRSKGQVIVIFALALTAMLLFAGLALDAGSLYLTYGQLKRAVDASAVAAATDFKRSATLPGMKESAAEVLRLHNIDIEAVNLELFVCDADGDGSRDAGLQTTVPMFFARCPDTTAGDSPRKLVWVEADLRAPLYFLGLLGFDAVTLHTNAISEAAPVDVVIVIDISESMASDTLNTICADFRDNGLDCPYVDNYDPDGSNPPDYSGLAVNGCNLDNSCQPLFKAKDAAKALIDKLYQGYDQVSVVTFDSLAVVHPIPNLHSTNVDLSDDLTAAKTVIDGLTLHDDPPFAKIWPRWYENMLFNPVNPEDRDGDGSDFDPNLPTCDEAPTNPLCCTLDDDRWDDSKDPFGWGGLPCDDSFKLDAYNWVTDEDGDGDSKGDGEPGDPDDIATYTEADHNASVAWRAAHDPDGGGPLEASLSPLSTCTGCGMRAAANVLKSSGRPGSVWVVVFLSDGIVNLSDTYDTNTNIPAAYTNGFCTGELGGGFWSSVCVDFDPTPRYCIDAEQKTCPPSTNWQATVPNNNYSVFDYALDMVDEAALTKSENLDEPAGNDIAVYTIGLGAVGGNVGEDLLRYMAAVGDDGDRTTDPCKSMSVGAAQSCGQYYYAPDGNKLRKIFEDIATRIYTRIAN